jgi:hypothetical protein
MGSVSLLHILGTDGEVARDGLIVSDGVVLAKYQHDIHCLSFMRSQGILVLFQTCACTSLNYIIDTSTT